MYSSSRSRPSRRSTWSTAAVASSSASSVVSSTQPVTPPYHRFVGGDNSSAEFNPSMIRSPRTPRSTDSTKLVRNHPRRRARSQTRDVPSSSSNTSERSLTESRSTSLQPSDRIKQPNHSSSSSSSKAPQKYSWSVSSTPQQSTSQPQNEHPPLLSFPPNPLVLYQLKQKQQRSSSFSSSARATEAMIDNREGNGYDAGSCVGQHRDGSVTASDVDGEGSVHSAPTASTASRPAGRHSFQTSRDDDRGGEPQNIPREKRSSRSSIGQSSTFQNSNSDNEQLHAKLSRNLMDGLSRAQGSERRMTAILKICVCCDHKDEWRHNVELKMGMLTAMAWSLQTAMNDDEIRKIGAALEMVMQASPRDLQSAYFKIHSNSTHHHHSLLSNLLRVLERSENNAIKHAETSILNISKIIFYLSRCPELRTSLCRQAGVLKSLERVGGRLEEGISTAGDASVLYNNLVNQVAEVRFYRMRTLANLANVEENKVLLLDHQNGLLLESVLRVAHWDVDDLTRQYASSILMDLASAPTNQVSMAANDKVLGTLIKMTLVEQNTATREFVITALQNLAFCKDNRQRMVIFKDCILLEALKQALSTDTDAKARRRAAGALTNLVCDETAECMGQHKGLLDTLAVVAAKDDNWDVQTRASLALTKIANCISVNMNCHGDLLDALVVASLSKANNSIWAVLRVKARIPENRDAMARHPGIIDTLTDVCHSVDTSKKNDRDNAVRALMHLANEDRNRKILCCRNVLDALVAGANYADSELVEARDSAIRALERLATEHANRSIMARHSGLLTVVAQAVERETLLEDDGSESPENGYLAKSLLMSLLIAL